MSSTEVCVFRSQNWKLSVRKQSRRSRKMPSWASECRSWRLRYMKNNRWEERLTVRPSVKKEILVSVWVSNIRSFCNCHFSRSSCCRVCVCSLQLWVDYANLCGMISTILLKSACILFSAILHRADKHRWVIVRKKVGPVGYKSSW